MSQYDRINFPLEAPARFVCPLISYERQRQMLGLLFRELSIAAKRHFALGPILESIAISRRIRPGFSYAAWGLMVVVTAAILIVLLMGNTTAAIFTAVVGALGFLLMSVSRHDDYVRYVANRLAGEMNRGRSLAQAMERMPLTFTREERRIVAMGEATGQLGPSLEALAEYNFTAGRFSRLALAFLYPLIIAAICSLVGGFILTNILPKYQDIFEGMGLTLPAYTAAVLRFVHPIAGLFFLLSMIVLPFLLLIFLTFTVPRFGQGSVRMTLFILPILCAPVCYLLADAVARNVTSPFGLRRIGDPLVTLVVFIMLFIVFTIVAYWSILWTNAFLPPFLHRIADRLLAWFGPLRRMHLSRFLLSLSYLLRARIPMPEALSMAGQTTRGRLRRDALTMRAMVEQGHSLTEALAISPVLRGRPYEILALAEWRGSVVEDSLELAEDLRLQGERSAERLAAAIEWPGILLVGLIIALFAFAMYLPIFELPIEYMKLE